MRVAIRPVRGPDVACLARIYRDSIRHAGARHYSPDQVRAWSALGEDPQAFQAWLDGARTFVAIEENGACIGFAGLAPAMRIASLFVAPAFMGQGVGSALVRHLLSELARAGASGATTEASELSRPVFERCGFRVLEVEDTIVRGVAFSRYRMRLDISQD